MYSSKKSDSSRIEGELSYSPDMFDSPPLEMESSIIATEDLAVPSSSTKKYKNTETWRGAPMTEIYQSNSPWTAPEFPVVSPAYNHCVTYHISKTPTVGVGKQPPIPQQGRDLWDKDHVRMPYSMQSLYPVDDGNGKNSLKYRWDLIVQALSQPIKNSHELEVAILKYNTKYQHQWKFIGLHKLFDEYLEEEESDHFFNSTLPAIAELALKLPILLPSSIPLLRQHHNRSVSFSQEQVSCLLANAFFCTFPRRNTNKRQSEYSSYPEINFYRLFQGRSKRVLEKLKCIFHYFRTVCKTVPCGVVTFTRRTVEDSKCPDWSNLGSLIGSVPLHIDSKGTIENEGAGLLQVDFANKYLGGGVLGGGSVQEEIRFVICPEMMISMLFTEVLKPTEALLMIGCERYSDYVGYADAFQWSGNHTDPTEFDSSGRRRCAVVAIDALRFTNPSFQYKPELITRELNKAWVGYSVHVDPMLSGLSLPAVATGNWGCGAFRGSPYLKALLQLMACCQSRRPMVYYTFDNQQLRDDISNMYNFLCQQNITVGTLFNYLCKFHESAASSDQLYPFLLQHHKDVQKSTQQSVPYKNPTALKNNVTSFQEIPKPMNNKQVADDSTSSPHRNKLSDLVSHTVSNKTVEIDKSHAKDTSSIEKSSADEIVCRNVNTDSLKKHTSKNSSLIDEMAHFDRANCSSDWEEETQPKKKVALSFFDKSSAEENKSSCSKRATEIRNNSSEKKTQPDNTPTSIFSNKVPSGKIYEYFQRVQRK